jgi:hypothetical protein
MKAFWISALLSLAAQASWADCAPSAADFAALAQSTSKIASQAQIDALPTDQQDRLCRTRANYQRHLQTHEPLHGVDEISTRYLSPEERKVYSAWLDDMFRRSVDQHPDTLDSSNLDQVKGAIAQPH